MPNHLERLSNLKRFLINIIGRIQSKDWKKFEQNNKTISLNILFLKYNTKQIKQAYISKYSHEQDNQVILLMITNDDGNWHYLAIKSISALLRGITKTFTV